MLLSLLLPLPLSMPLSLLLPLPESLQVFLTELVVLLMVIEGVAVS